MQGTNANVPSEKENQPQAITASNNLWLPLLPPVEVMQSGIYDYVYGCIRHASVVRGESSVTGWVLCYADGKPITYADANQPGSINVAASGSYITQTSN